MELTPRLRAIADLVPHGAAFADIGTDHAYLPTWLLLNGVICRAVAADINRGPLDRARETAKKYAVEDRMDFRLCDGLTGMRQGEVNTIAIAGMGGDMIAHILAGVPWVKNRDILLLLQPMTSQRDLRQWLSLNGYCIENERYACEGEKIYVIMSVRAGQVGVLSDAELWGGRQNNDPLRGAYLSHIANKVNKVLAGHRSASNRDEEKIGQLETVLAGLNAMKEEWDAWQR